mgnify:CR=1 FL=1
MSNKYTEGAANVLLHLHPATEKTGHDLHTEHSKPQSCPECNAGEDDIVTNELPTHHIEFTCRCLKCGFEWMPNSDD